MSISCSHTYFNLTEPQPFRIIQIKYAVDNDGDCPDGLRKIIDY